MLHNSELIVLIILALEALYCIRLPTFSYILVDYDMINN